MNGGERMVELTREHVLDAHYRDPQQFVERAAAFLGIEDGDGTLYERRIRLVRGAAVMVDSLLAEGEFERAYPFVDTMLELLDEEWAART